MKRSGQYARKLGGRMKTKISEFDVGDVVVLTSGNIPMTVVEVDYSYHVVRVEWIASNGVPYAKEYPPEALLLVDNN